MKFFKLLILILILFCIAVFSSIFVGPISQLDWQIFMTFRLPRTLSAIAVGGGLAVGGATLQAILANPLADPYTMGIASAGALGAVLGSLFHLSTPFIDTSMLAFLCALGSLILLLSLTKQNTKYTKELLLMGVISGFVYSSMVTLVLAVTDPTNWTTALGWLLGSLSHASVQESFWAVTCNLLITIVLWFQWKGLDILAVDEELAQSTGVDVTRLRKRVFLLTSLLTAVNVSIAGVIGFVGLLVPHALRYLGSTTYRTLIPLCFFAGATLLLGSDVIARVVVRQTEIPVGVIMSLLGGPVFLYMVRRLR